MGTKENPGQFDCYKTAADDEPLFILKSTDEVGGELVALWAALRDKDLVSAAALFADLTQRARDRAPGDPFKIAEAYECARDMVLYRAEHGGRGNKLIAGV